MAAPSFEISYPALAREIVRRKLRQFAWAGLELAVGIGTGVVITGLWCRAALGAALRRKRA